MPRRLRAQRSRPRDTPGGWQAVAVELRRPVRRRTPRMPGSTPSAAGGPGGRGVRSRCSTPASPTPTAARSAARPTCQPAHCVRGYDFVAHDPLPQRPQRPRDARRRRRSREATNNRFGTDRPGLRGDDHARARPRLPRRGRRVGHRRRRPLRRRPRRAGDQPLPRVLDRRQRRRQIPELARRARRYATPARARLLVGAVGQRGAPRRSPTPRAPDDSIVASAPRPSTAASPTTRTWARASTSSAPGRRRRRGCTDDDPNCRPPTGPAATSTRSRFTGPNGAPLRHPRRLRGHVDGRAARRGGRRAGDRVTASSARTRRRRRSSSA